MAVAAPVITFLSDYGLEDDFVGVCHGVIATVCPRARLIDISHGIPRHDIRAAALVLRGALAYVPLGVHLAVIDPGVGGERRAVALRAADGRLFVGPDNGLLSPAAELAGGVVEAVDIGRSQFRLEPVAATFHGRDIFAPVAARLAGGATPASAGEPLDPTTLARLELPRPSLADGVLVAHALYIDRFGNVQLNVGHEQIRDFGLALGHPVELLVGPDASHRALYVRTFAEANVDQLLIYEDADRRLAVAVNQGDAARRLGLSIDDEVRIRLR